MTDEEMLRQMRLRLPEDEAAEDGLLLSLLGDAAALIRALTWRDAVPPGLANAQVRLAVMLFNRMGMEGEKEHAEGDVRRAAEDLPEGLRREIFSFRRALT